jgi:hypothetical protein
MSAKVHATCTGTVLTTWESKQPERGKAYSQFKLKLDDEYRGANRWEGRAVSIRSYSQQQYLPPIATGKRVFVIGQCDAVGYLSKDGKPAAFMQIIAKDVLPEQGSDPAVGTVATAAPAATATSPIDDDDMPF